MIDFTSPVLEGHFHLECLDKNDNIIDVFDDHNMIMTSARKSMAEIFCKLDESTYANKFVIGNFGCKEGQILNAKDDTDGFTKARTSLFSEIDDVIYHADLVMNTLLNGTYFKYNFDLGTTNNYTLYKYTGSDRTDLTLSDSFIQSYCTEVTDTPNVYTVNFTLPGHSMESSENCAVTASGATGVDEARVSQTDTSATFTFVISTDNANGDQVNANDYDTPTSLFNEAAIYVNGRIFCMKCFPTKTKDLTVKLRVTWTITF